MSVYKLMAIVVVMFCSVMYTTKAASQSKVKALVSTNKVSVGEAFDFQIQVESNTDKIVPPDLSNIKSFNYSYLGASKNSSFSTTVINGQRKVSTKNTFILNYKLMPLKEGTLTIPSMNVDVEGKSYSTEAISIVVSKDNELEQMGFLRYKLSKTNVCLGETVPLELVWYFRNNPRLNSIDIPTFTDDRFVVSKISPPKKVDRNQRLVEISFNGGKYWALQGESIVNGVAYVTLTMKWYIAPKVAGDLELKPSTIIASYIVGYRENPMFRGIPRGFSSVFDDDPFFSGREPVMKQIATKTTPEQIEVQALPLKGRPDNFSGVVSKIQLGSETKVKEASVGEPIEVDLFVSGSDNIYNMSLPDFNKQSDIKGKFKVSVDTSDDVLIDKMRIFKLIFRALDPKVTSIPPLKIAYYDPQEKDYKEAKSFELPISIKAAKIVTASDIESNSEPSSKRSVAAIEENVDGIFENITDESALVNKDISVGKYLSDNKVFFSVFPGCYFSLLLGQLVVNRRKKSAGGRAAGKAVNTFYKQLAVKNINAAILSVGIIDYFKTKFQVVDRELTLSEVYEHLMEKTSINDKTLVNFKKIVDYCEACCYTGVTEQELSMNFIESVKRVISQIDSEL